MLAAMLRALIAAVVVLGAQRSWACSCAVGPPDSDFVSHAARRHLPADAKGVLFRITPPRGVHLSTLSDETYLESLPAGPDISEFTLTDVTVKKSEKVALKNLSHERLPETQIRYPVFGPKKGFPICPRFGAADPRCRTAKQRFEAGELQNLTEEAGRRYGIFRVEPVEGFKVGHEYRFEYAPTKSSVDVVIDDQKVGWLPDSAVTLVAGLVGTRELIVAAPASCVDEVRARVQELRFVVAPALQRYRDSLLFFTKRARHHQPGGYSPHACFWPAWGRGGLAPGEELLYIDCDTGSAPLEWVEQGTWAFLEVDGVAHDAGTLRGKLKCE